MYRAGGRWATVHPGPHWLSLLLIGRSSQCGTDLLLHMHNVQSISLFQLLLLRLELSAWQVCTSMWQFQLFSFWYVNDDRVVNYLSSRRVLCLPWYLSWILLFVCLFLFSFSLFWVVETLCSVFVSQMCTVLRTWHCQFAVWRTDRHCGRHPPLVLNTSHCS